MKRVWIIAIVVCTALMVSCGGEKKGSDKSEPVYATMTFTDPVEIKTAELANRLVAALKAGNEELAYQIADEAKVYGETLSEIDKVKFDNLGKKIMEEAGYGRN